MTGVVAKEEVKAIPKVEYENEEESKEAASEEE